jgi:hypothetical protein
MIGKLQKGLQQSAAHYRGELTLKTIKVPAGPPQIDAATGNRLPQRRTAPSHADRRLYQADESRWFEDCD